MWCGPISVHVQGLFYGAPYHDVPAMIAYLTILITTVNFVVSVEVNLLGNQRIIAGNAQFTGIAAGRGVGFTTGLLLLREGLGMRETPIRPHSLH